MLIRIDDFPTGIRPILPSLLPLIEILQEFERRNLPFVLGVVPALLKLVDESTLTALKQIKGMTPAVHGYTHSYFRLSPVLIASGDLFNEKGIAGSFDELAGIADSTVAWRLRKGREILENTFVMYVLRPAPRGW
jgi:hypothetical protein